MLLIVSYFQIDDDFIARYQAQYGVYDPQQQAELAQQTSQASTAPKPVAQQSKERVIEKPPEDLDEEGKKEWLKQRKKEKRKLVAERQRQQARKLSLARLTFLSHDQNALPFQNGLILTGRTIQACTYQDCLRISS